MSEKLIRDIEELVIRGQLDEALKILRDNTENNRRTYEEVMLLSTRFRSLERNRRLGIIDNREFLVEQHNINYSTIKLLSELKSDTQELQRDNIFFSHSKDFKIFGRFRTKMIPIFPYKKENMLRIENILFDYYPEKIYSANHYPQFYNEIVKHVNNKDTIYNEAKPHLLDYNIAFSEETQSHYIEMELGICGYIDFLAVSRNLDVEYLDQGIKRTIRQSLVNNGVDKDPSDDLNNVPKQLGVSSIVVTSDNYIVLQKRQKSEVASKMYHVSIAEGLQVFPSYSEFLALDKSEQQFRIVDKDLSFALYRGMEEELGIEEKEVNELELLSIYYDYELQQPIFQTSVLLNISSVELSKYYDQFKGRDTLAEIGRLDFIPNRLDDLLLYFYRTNQEGKWSSHAVINIISFIEKHYGSYKKIEKHLNKYFTRDIEFYLGDQKYIESIDRKTE